MKANRLLVLCDMRQTHIRQILCVSSLAIGCIAPHRAFGMSVALSPSAPSPAPVGTVVTWTAGLADASEGTAWFRFRVRRAGEEPRTIQDFGPLNSFDWTASDYDGAFQIEVTARNLDTGESTTASQVFEMISRVAA